MMPISRRLIAALIITLTCGVGAAMANSVPLGTTTLSFLDGSTVTGYFDLNAGANTLTSWSFTTTAGTFPAETFNSADPAAAAPTGTIVSNFNGDEVLSFEENLGPFRQELDIVVACGGVLNCLTQATTATPMSFAVEGPIAFPSPCPGQFCIESGLQNVPETLVANGLAPGFLNVTDPSGVFAFNIATTATGTVFNGGGGPTVPEPSSLLLLGSGLIGIGTLRRRMRIQR